MPFGREHVNLLPVVDKYLKGLFALLALSVSLVPAWAQSAWLPDMVLVHGGSYIQGSLEQPYADTERAHETMVSSFYLARTETTQALWKEIMGSNPSKFLGNDRPVDSVSWLEAVKFCNALSLKAGLQPAYEISLNDAHWLKEASGYRLPTEAEWEYAARGGIYGAVGSQALKKVGYSGGGDAEKLAWFDRNSGKSSQVVAKKQANELGFFDMSGNVWEWCWDWYGEYPKTAVVDPDGAAKSGFKVLRGGAWFTPANLLRTTYRYWNSLSFKANSIGFRIARNAPN